VVRNGSSNETLGYSRDHHPLHTRENIVYHMFFTVCHEYRSLPDPRSLDTIEVEAFYDAIRPTLMEKTRKPDAS
jgi:hypothetical protein